MSAPEKIVGRYALFDELARGGMATVHLGRLLGPAGFSRTVAIKRLHPHLAKDPEFVTMLLDEARLAGRIQHPKVVATLDIVASDGELFIVMDYLHGETLARLLRLAGREKDAAKRPLAPAVAAAIAVDTLQGLHAAHEVKGERGELLGLVHRDFTPQNIMVRRDGMALVVDFGVAKAAGRYQTTEEGKIKGKLPYMAPEQIRAEKVTRRTDIYAAGAVLWETLTTKRLFDADNDGALLQKILFGKVVPPSTYAPDVPPALDAVVMRALERDADARFATAEEMANAIEAAIDPVRPAKVAAWLERLAGEALDAQAARLAELETMNSGEQLTLPRALEEVNQSPPTKLDVARPGPKLTDSEIRRSKDEITAPAPASSAGPTSAPAPTSAKDPSEPTTRLESSSAVLVLADPKPARRIWPILLVGGAAAGAVALFLAMRGAGDASKGGERAASEAALTATASAPSPGAAPAPSGVAVTPTAPASASSSPGAPGASSSAVATAPNTAAPINTGFKPPTATPKPPTEDCSVPTYIDADGRKKYKRGCLK